MSKHFYFKQFSLAQIHILNAKTLNSQKPQLSSIWPIDRSQMLRVRVDLEAMAMGGYSAFPKALGSLESPIIF